jgi:hypothetical protein
MRYMSAHVPVSKISWQSARVNHVPQQSPICRCYEANNWRTRFLNTAPVYRNHQSWFLHESTKWQVNSVLIALTGVALFSRSPQPARSFGVIAAIAAFAFAWLTVLMRHSGQDLPRQPSCWATESVLFALPWMFSLVKIHQNGPWLLLGIDSLRFRTTLFIAMPVRALTPSLSVSSTI